MKRTLVYILLISNLIFLTGCWNYSEIDDFSIASALSIDKNENGDYSLVGEFLEVNPSQSGISFKTNFIEATGKTILEAIRNMIPISNKRLYWSHATIIVLSEDVALDSLLPVLDWIMRDPFPRPTVHLYISREKTAREIIETENESTKILNFQFEKVIKAFKYSAKSPHIETYRVANQVNENKFYSVLPTIEMIFSGNKNIASISGAAFFSGDKLEGFLNPSDTMKYLFIVNELEKGLLVIHIDEKDNDKVTLDILKNKTKLKADISPTEITMNITINTDVSISEIDNGVDYTNKEGRKLLKENIENYIEKEIETFIKYIQKEYALDIFNFGDYIRRNHPNTWKIIEKDWDSIFRELNVNVKSNINIKGSGQISKPIKAGE